MNNNEDNLLEDTWEARLIDYSMGTMPASEAVELERQLDECRVRVKLADHYAQVVGWMGAAAVPAEPPEGHKARLLSRLSATPQEQEGAQPDPGPLASPGRLALVEAPPARPASRETAQQAVPTPATSLDEYRTRRAGGSRALWIGAAAAVLALLVVAGWLSSFLSRPYLPAGYVPIAVQSQPGAPESSAVLFYNPERRDAYFFADGLQAASTDKVYEMWLLPKGGGNPVPAGIFNAGSGGTTRHDIQAPAEMGQYAGVAVSLEKAPGGTVVAGPVLLVGQYGTGN